MVKKFGQILVTDPEILALNQVAMGAPSLYEAFYPPMIVAVALLGPLPRSDNPLQATYTLGTCLTSMMCCQKCSQIFDTSRTSRPDKSKCQCTMMI